TFRPAGRPADAGNRLAAGLLGSFRDQAGQLLGLAGVSLHLLAGEGRLDLEGFLEILGLEQLLGQRKARLHVLVGILQALLLDGLGLGLGAAGGALDKVLGLAARLGEVPIGLAGLVNAL